MTINIKLFPLIANPGQNYSSLIHFYSNIFFSFNWWASVYFCVTVSERVCQLENIFASTIQSIVSSTIESKLSSSSSYWWIPPREIWERSLESTLSEIWIPKHAMPIILGKSGKLQPVFANKLDKVCKIYHVHCSMCVEAISDFCFLLIATPSKRIYLHC